MYDLQAYAARQEESVYVTLTGLLDDSSHQATVQDFYPGGSIVYLADPGSAEVFIEESRQGDRDLGAMSLIPWIAHLTLPDTEHEYLTVLINDEPVLKVKIHHLPESFRVIALGGTYVGCAILPAEAPYPPAYHSVFGPAPRRDCEHWRDSHCAQEKHEKSY
ncbi:hypothetical protein [Chitinimonas lacunae]|uniref:Uncharacterized protein n=1 Tax=Chitinimonas lacunae TaxID=1963018 RepID=A0ABV8MKC0_9NEIS